MSKKKKLLNKSALRCGSVRVSLVKDKKKEAKKMLGLLGRASQLKHIGAGAALGGAWGAGAQHMINKTHPMYKGRSKKFKKRMVLSQAVINALVGGWGGREIHKVRKSMLSDARSWGRQSARFKRGFNWKREGNRGNRWGRGRSHSSGATSAGANKPKHSWSDFGVDMGSATTKREAKRKFYGASKKHHPDVGGDPEKMKDLNKLWSDFKGSGSYDKLAKLMVAPKSTLTQDTKNLSKRLSTKNPAVDSFERKKGKMPGMPQETNTMKSASSRWGSLKELWERIK